MNELDIKIEAQKSEALKELDQHLRAWTSTSMGRRSFIASMGLLLASCATPDQTRYREGDNSGQEIDLTIDDEKRMTQEVMPQMTKDYPKLNNPDLQNYVSGLGRRIASTSGYERNPYSYNFTVVDVDYVNAFALPAGTIFVTTPLIAMAESEAELAGVIGHEMGHIQARHTAERMEKAKRAETSSWKYALGGGLLGGALGYGLGRLTCPPKDNECLSKAAQMGAAAGAGGGLLIQKYGFMANSREDEMEADRIGFRVATKAGYDKDSVGSFYAKLLQMEKQSKGQNPQVLQRLQDAMSTHPPSQERVNQMNQMASESPKSVNAIRSSAEFDRMRMAAQRVAAERPAKKTS